MMRRLAYRLAVRVNGTIPCARNALASIALASGVLFCRRERYLSVALGLLVALPSGDAIGRHAPPSDSLATACGKVAVRTVDLIRGIDGSTFIVRYDGRPTSGDASASSMFAEQLISSHRGLTMD